MLRGNTAPVPPALAEEAARTLRPRFPFTGRGDTLSLSGRSGLKPGAWVTSTGHRTAPCSRAEAHFRLWEESASPTSQLQNKVSEDGLPPGTVSQASVTHFPTNEGTLLMTIEDMTGHFSPNVELLSQQAPTWPAHGRLALCRLCTVSALPSSEFQSRTKSKCIQRNCPRTHLRWAPGLTTSPPRRRFPASWAGPSRLGQGPSGFLWVLGQRRAGSPTSLPVEGVTQPPGSVSRGTDTSPALCVRGGAPRTGLPHHRISLIHNHPRSGHSARCSCYVASPLHRSPEDRVILFVLLIRNRNSAQLGWKHTA